MNPLSSIGIKVVFVGFLFGGFLWGVLSDNFGRRRVSQSICAVELMLLIVLPDLAIHLLLLVSSPHPALKDPACCRCRCVGVWYSQCRFSQLLGAALVQIRDRVWHWG